MADQELQTGYVPFTASRYGDGTVKVARTNEQRGRLSEQAYDYARQYRPVTLRQLYYLLVNNGWLYKTEREYKNLGVLLTKMRRDDRLPWAWIIDAGRYTRVAQTWTDPADIVNAVAQSFRRDIWVEQESRVYIGVEKQALAAVFAGATNEYAVPVVVAMGYPSSTYQHDLEGELWEIVDAGQGFDFFYYGDHDPSGDGIADLFEEIVVRVGGTFHRSALTAEQIIDRDYLTRPPKAGDSRTANWYDGGAEAADVDAIPPDELRQMITDDIESVIDIDRFDATMEQQVVDRARLQTVADQWEEEDASR